MTSRNLPAIAVAAVLLAALYFILKPQHDALQKPAPAASSQIAHVMPLSVDHPSHARIAVREGDTLALDVTSSRDGEISAHGLSQNEFPVEAGKVTRVLIRASGEGVFPLHFHGAGGEHTAVAELEISARGLDASHATAK